MKCEYCKDTHKISLPYPFESVEVKCRCQAAPSKAKRMKEIMENAHDYTCYLLEQEWERTYLRRLEAELSQEQESHFLRR